MESGKVYVISIGNNLDEGMTKEQIIAAIAETTGETPTHIDDAFITKLQEQNRNRNLKVWVGTQYEYNQIVPTDDTVYVITDANEYEDLDARLTQAEGEIDELQRKFQYSTTDLEAGVSDLETGTLYFVYEE